MPRAAMALLQILLLCAKQVTTDTVTGKATFYYPADGPGAGIGACGTAISDNDLEGALGCASFGPHLTGPGWYQINFRRNQTAPGLAVAATLCSYRTTI